MSQPNTAPPAPVATATVLVGTSICSLMHSEARMASLLESKSNQERLLGASEDDRVDMDRKIANKKNEITKLEAAGKKRLVTEDGYRTTIAKFADSITKERNLQQLLKTAKLSIEFKAEPQDLQHYQVGVKKQGTDGRMRNTPGRSKWCMKPVTLLADSKKGRVNLTDDQLGELKAQCANGNGTSLTCVVTIAKDPKASSAAQAAAKRVALEAEVVQLRAERAEFELMKAQLAAIQQQQQQQQQHPNPTA